MKSPGFNIDYMRWRKLFAGLSITFVLISLYDIFVNGLTLGLDFTGGTLVEVQFPESAQPEEVRVALEQSGYRNAVVQLFGSDRDVLVRMPPQPDADQARMADEIVATLGERFGDVRLEQANFVGPVVGEELRDDAITQTFTHTHTHKHAIVVLSS